MLYRLLALGSLISLVACNGVHEPSTPTPSVNTGLESSRPIELEATLTELTQRPTPSGLPTRLQITSPRLPGPGEKVEITWRALDGSPQMAPRAGSGFFVPRAGSGFFVLADGRTINITLIAVNGGDQATLVLEGTLEGAQARGNFADRLFYPRSGVFVAQIRQE